MARTVEGARSWFFGAKASIEGGIHDDAVLVEIVPAKRRPREDVDLGLLHERQQEAPRLPRFVVRNVHPHVAAPDDAYARLLQRAGEPGGLRVVKQGDVAGPEELVEGTGVPLHRRPVDGPLGVSERSAVARHAVEPVVDALRHPGRTRDRPR
jgi:hypothetical protein